VDSSDKLRYEMHKQFTTMADAKSFINSFLNVSQPVITT
jgi:hypothetical protein